MLPELQRRERAERSAWKEHVCPWGRVDRMTFYCMKFSTHQTNVFKDLKRGGQVLLVNVFNVITQEAETQVDL